MFLYARKRMSRTKTYVSTAPTTGRHAWGLDPASERAQRCGYVRGAIQRRTHKKLGRMVCFLLRKRVGTRRAPRSPPRTSSIQRVLRWPPSSSRSHSHSCAGQMALAKLLCIEMFSATLLPTFHTLKALRPAGFGPLKPRTPNCVYQPGFGGALTVYLKHSWTKSPVLVRRLSHPLP